MKPKRAQPMFSVLADVPSFPVTGAIMGIDPSLTGNAVCVLRAGEAAVERKFTSKPAKTVRERVERYDGLVLEVGRMAKRYGVGVAFVEGYAFSKKQGRGVLDRAEFRGVLYRALVRLGVVVVEVDPMSLKLFACDHGGADKDGVKAGLEQRYGHAPFKDDDDRADAFGMAMVGMCATGRSACESAAQRDVVVKVVQLLKEAA